VYVTSEAPLPDELSQHALPVPPELLHDLLAYADCYVGDSQTMATEAAVLGTPAVRTNAFVGEDDMSNFRELEAEYGLLRSFAAEDDAIDCAVSFLSAPPTETMERRRQRLLDAKTDVTAFLLDVITEQAHAAGADTDGDSGPDRASERSRGTGVGR
jgi:predicted glycosyltransferase